MVLTHLTLVTLTFDLVTPKSKGFLCCPGRMCGPRHSRVIDRKRKGYRLTDRPTDWQTCAKQYGHSFLRKGGIIICWEKVKKSKTNGLQLSNLEFMQTTSNSYISVLMPYLSSFARTCLSRNQTYLVTVDRLQYQVSILVDGQSVCKAS